MRKIRFRVWNKIRKKYIYDLSEFDCYGLPNIEISNHKSGGFFIDIGDDLIVELYTGLKDNNSVEICEGDIVETEGGRYEVVFHEASFCIKIETDTTPAYWTFRYRSTRFFTVIGNKNENPELLEV